MHHGDLTHTVWRCIMNELAARRMPVGWLVSRTDTCAAAGLYVMAGYHPPATYGTHAPVHTQRSLALPGPL